MGKKDEIEEAEGMGLGLTDQERAALEGDDDEIEAKAGDADDEGADEGESDKDGAEALKAKGDGEEGDADGADDEGTDADADADAKADAKADADDTSKGEAEAEEGDDDLALQMTAPVVPDWKAPADAKEKIAEIDQKLEALSEQFDNGEITAKELRAQERDLLDQRTDLKMALDREQMAQQMATTTWLQSTVPTFLGKYTHYRDDATLGSLLDTKVRELQVAAANDGKNPLDPKILLEADKQIRASLKKLAGIDLPAPKGEGGKPASKPAGAKSAADKGKGKSPSALGKVPRTLANLPASDMNDTEDGQFAALDRLAQKDPVAFEEALAKLPESEQERYLRYQ